jgi:hypothetical protein
MAEERIRLEVRIESGQYVVKCEECGQHLLASDGKDSFSQIADHAFKVHKMDGGQLSKITT